jgi:Tfp pilus assembly protein PilF
MRKPRLLRLTVCCLAILSLAGCSAMRTWRTKAEETDVGRLREQRREEVVHGFERRRVMAQLQAARERADQGDPEAAEEILHGILERDPSVVAARVQLAELYWAHEELAEAEQQLRKAVELAPEQAELHHLLGVLLDAQGNEAEANVELIRAVELEPDNKLYRMTAESAGITNLPPPSTRSAGRLADAAKRR